MKKNRPFLLLTSIALTLSSCASSSGSGVDSSSRYTVTWKNYDGTVLETDLDVKEGDMPSYDGADPTRPDDEEFTYSWTGWSPKVASISADTVFTATYESSKLVYSIAYVLNGGTNDPKNPSTYRVGTTLTFGPASKDGYGFNGWYDASGKKATGIDKDTKGDLVLTACYDANKNELDVASEDDAKGTVKILEGSGYTGESIKVEAYPKLGYLFDGWYHDRSKISADSVYTFTMPSSDYSLLAKFALNEEEAAHYGIMPVPSSDYTTMTYGLYPKNNINNSTLIGALNKLTTPEGNGWYLYNGEYYAKTVAAPRDSKYTFQNGTTIVSGTAYWFKCEPIKWKVLEISWGEFYLLSADLLDAHCWHLSQQQRVVSNMIIYPNNYEYSDIRAWLNGYDGSGYEVNDYEKGESFLNSAFYLGDSYLETETIDNSAESTHSEANHYWCDDTEDKVTLASYQDLINPEYGFAPNRDNSDTRYCKTTDWARARGAYTATKYHPENGTYWTRSPDNFYNQTYNSWAANYMGGIGFDAVDYDGDSVRPAITVSLK